MKVTLVKWDDSLSVGIKSIDSQHKILLDIINEFYEKLNIKSNKELIAELILKMKGYAMLHFSREEKLFAKYNYTKIAEHKREHQLFIDKISEIEQRYRAGKIVLSFEITSYLKDWLIHHIKGSDMKYAKLLVDCGVK